LPTAVCFLVGLHDLTKLGWEYWPKWTRLQNTATKNHLILTYLTTFSLERIDKISCHSCVFLIRPTCTQDNCLGVDLKILIFWFVNLRRRQHKFTWIVINKNFPDSLPSQPFLGCHLGIHIFFRNGFLGATHFLIQLGFFG